MNESKPVLIVIGPTASGKSACAVDLASEFDGVVINCDSMQIYRDLTVITARPDHVEQAGVPHRLYGILDAADPCSAMRWRDMVLVEIEEAHRAGKLPILCGGTGLYVKALREGLSPTPEIPDEIRKDIRERALSEGPEVLHDELSALDPVMAARLNRIDSQRVARALEVVTATGRSLSDWQDDIAEPAPDHLSFYTLSFLPEREALYDGINTRFNEMVERGALEEVKTLMDRNLNPNLPCMKALGVPDLIQHLRGEIPLEQAVTNAATKSRRYAKRQVTWLRRQIISDILINEKYSETLRGKIFAFVREKLLTP